MPAVNLSDFDALRKAKHECLLSGGLCCTWCRWQQPLAPGGAVRDEGLYFLRSRFSSGPTKALFADCVLLRAHRGERAGLSTLGGTLDMAVCRRWRACGCVCVYAGADC